MKRNYKDLLQRIEKLPDKYKEELTEFCEGLLEEYETELKSNKCNEEGHLYGPWEEQTVGDWAPEMAGYWFAIKPDMKTKNVYERKCTRCGIIQTVFDIPEDVKKLTKKKDEN